MNINRRNYEEYFLLCLDQELSPAERRELEDFLRENPDLEGEWRMWQETVLQPDAGNVFPDKQSLLKDENNSPVNADNYESWFVQYADDELKEEEQARVEEFLFRHPVYKKEFDAIRLARLEPDPLVVFPNKESLLKREGGGRVIAFGWWRQAVAAAVILMISGFSWWLLQRPAAGGGTEVAGRTESISPSVAEQPVQRSDARKDLPETASVNPGETNLPAQQILSGSRRQATAKVVNQVAQHVDMKGKGQETDPNEIQPSKNSTQTSNYLPQPSVPTLQAVAEAETPVQVEVPGAKANRLGPAKADTDWAVSFDELDKNDRPAPDQYDGSGSDNQVAVLNTSLSNEHKTRGLFRKISRVMDKASHIGNGDEEESGKKGLRIASFEIALR